MGMARGGRGSKTDLGVQKTIQKQAAPVATKVTLKKAVVNKVTELNQTGQLSQDIRLGAVAKSLAQLDEETALSVLDLGSLTGIEDPNRFLQDAVQAILEDDEDGEEELGNGAEAEQPVVAAHGSSGAGKGPGFFQKRAQQAPHAVPAEAKKPGFFSKRAQEMPPAAAAGTKGSGFFRERAKGAGEQNAPPPWKTRGGDGKAGKLGGKGGNQKGKGGGPQLSQEVMVHLRTLSRSGKLHEPLEIEKVSPRLAKLDAEAAMKIIDSLEERADQITRPTGWLLSQINQAVERAGGEAGPVNPRQVMKRLTWINSNVKLAKPLDVDRCVKALSPLTHSVAMRLLINLQAQFEKIQDPNGWLCKSAQKQAQESAAKEAQQRAGQFAPARLATPRLPAQGGPAGHPAPPRGRGRGGAGAKLPVIQGGKGGATLTASQAKVSRFVKWIDKNCAVRQPLIYSNVKAALDLVDETGQMRILTMLKEKAAEIPNPQGWVWARCKRSAEQFNKRMQDRSRAKAEERARGSTAPQRASASSAAEGAEGAVVEAEEEDGLDGLDVGAEEEGGEVEMVEEVAEFAEGAEEEAADFAEGGEEEAMEVEWVEGAEEEAVEGDGTIPLDEGEA